MKTRKIDDYCREAMGVKDKETPVYLSISIVSTVFFYAFRDKVTNLTMTQDQYECVANWMVYSGMWNWDRNTFMGIKLEIYDR